MRDGKLVARVAFFGLQLLVGCDYHGTFAWWSPSEVRLEGEAVRPVDQAATATIHKPRDGEVIMADLYDGTCGVVGSLPSGYRLYVFLADRFGWYLQFPPARVDPVRSTFSVQNIRIASDGAWEIHICLATPQASRFLDSCARRGEWGGFPSLPEGFVTLDSVAVFRRKAAPGFHGTQG